MYMYNKRIEIVQGFGDIPAKLLDNVMVSSVATDFSSSVEWYFLIADSNPGMMACKSPTDEVIALVYMRA